jgi:hypothetical protein
MKKIYLFIVLISTSLFAQQNTNIKGSVWGNIEKSKKVYISPNLEKEIKNHKTIAVLPFNVLIQYKKTPKNYSDSSNKKAEMDLSTNIQFELYSELSDKNKNYTVEIQNIEVTNQILKDFNMLYTLQNYSPSEVAKTLKVDALIDGSYVYTKVGSEGGAIVSQLLIGEGKVAVGELNMKIYNGPDSELLWSITKAMNQDALSSPKRIINRMMNKLGRNFPYKK